MHKTWCTLVLSQNRWAECKMLKNARECTSQKRPRALGCSRMHAAFKKMQKMRIPAQKMRHTANKPREESRCDLYMFSAMASLFVSRKVARQARLLHALPTSTSHTGTTRTAMKPPQRDPRSSPRIIASHARNPWITARCQI